MSSGVTPVTYTVVEASASNSKQDTVALEHQMHAHGTGQQTSMETMYLSLKVRISPAHFAIRNMQKAKRAPELHTFEWVLRIMGA